MTYFVIQKSEVDIMVIPLFKPHIGYTDIEEGWQLKISSVQVDWTLVFMVWMESHIEVLGSRKERGNLVSCKK